MLRYVLLAGVLGALPACLNPDISDEDPVTMQAAALGSDDADERSGGDDPFEEDGVDAEPSSNTDSDSDERDDAQDDDGDDRDGADDEEAGDEEAGDEDDDGPRFGPRGGDRPRRGPPSRR